MMLGLSLNGALTGAGCRQWQGLDSSASVEFHQSAAVEASIPRVVWSLSVSSTKHQNGGRRLNLFGDLSV